VSHDDSEFEPSPMDVALTEIDDAYASYLLDREELGIDNGDMLQAAMDAGIAWPDFLATRK
jgi:hypothetical protein